MSEWRSPWKYSRVAIKIVFHIFIILSDIHIEWNISVLRFSGKSFGVQIASQTLYPHQDWMICYLYIHIYLRIKCKLCEIVSNFHSWIVFSSENRKQRSISKCTESGNRHNLFLKLFSSPLSSTVVSLQVSLWRCDSQCSREKRLFHYKTHWSFTNWLLRTI